MSQCDRLRWAALALAAAGLFVLTALATTRTGTGIAVDSAVRGWILNELPGPLRQGLDRLARPLVIVVLTPVLVVLALLALVRHRFRRAVTGMVVPTVATAVAFQLRVRETLGAAGVGFPSDHAVAGLGLLVGVAVVWPRALTRRGLVGVGVVACCIGLGNVAWYAHQPRDVVGSALLVLAVAAAAFAAIGGDSANLAHETWRHGEPGLGHEPARRSG